MKKIIIIALLMTMNLLAGDFFDTQITFSYGDDNIFETTRRSPYASFGERTDELFNENLNTYKSGDETESHLVVYKKIEGYIPKLTIESAFVMEFSLFQNETGESGYYIRENGTYIRLNYDINAANKLALTFFPYDSDRFLLGFTYDLSWGSQASWPKSKINKKTPVPGAKLEYTLDIADLEFNIFAGAKTRPYNVNLIEEDSETGKFVNNTVATTWAVMGGFYVDYSEMIRADVHLGRFYKGTNPLSGSPDKIDEENVLGSRIYANGASFRLSYRSNFDLSSSKEMKIYKNDPRVEIERFIEEKLGKDEKKEEIVAEVKPNFGYMISFEGVYLIQPLRDPDNRNALTDFKGMAFDVKLKAFFGDIKFNADYIQRNVEFLLFNVPGFTAFEGFSSDSVTLRNEQMFSLGGEYQINKIFTLGLLFGYKIPATYEGKDTGYKIVIKDREDMSSFTGGLRQNKVKLPMDESAKNITSAKIALISELAKDVTLTTEVFMLNDPNDTVVKDNKVQFRSSDETERLGFAIILQSNF